MIITDRGGTAIPTPSGTTLHLVYCSNGRGSSGGGGSDDDGDDGRSIDILCFAHTRPSRGDNKQKKKKANITIIYIIYTYITRAFIYVQCFMPNSYRYRLCGTSILVTTIIHTSLLLYRDTHIFYNI